MSNLLPSAITLDKGLDLQTPKPVAEPGSVLDSLNYEQVDFQGQKRIDGYARYDGSPLSAFDDFLMVTNADTTEFAPYLLAFNDGDLYGVVVGESGDVSYIHVIDYNSIPAEGVWAKDSGMFTAEEHYNQLLECNANLRVDVEDLPGPIAGLHWFRDRLYAVVDISDYTPDDDRIDTANKASLFESRSFQQVLEEDGPSGPYDFGWRFVHQGWVVEFENGKSLFGDLAALNQNRQGVGIQGPTDISGANGSPLVLLQSVNITNRPVQVNGWKSSNTPTTYILNPNDVAVVDANYAYADAYVSWSGTTGTISAPGSTGSGLVEYPATNTVNVDV